MFEFKPGSDWLPALGGVALLARNLQFVAVRTASRRARVKLLTDRNADRREEDDNDERGPKTLQN